MRQVIAMCKEIPVISVNKVVNKKRICNWEMGAEEEERHSRLLTPPPPRGK
jgi:hypothetical protein